MPRDNPKDTRFAINFFTSIGLGGLTLVFCFVLFCFSYSYSFFLPLSSRDDLREHLKNAQKLIMAQKQLVSSSDTDSDSEGSRLFIIRATLHWGGGGGGGGG